MQGAHPKVVSDKLGHPSMGLKLGTSSHLLPAVHQQVMDTFPWGS